MRNPAIRRWDRETALVAGIAAFVSAAAFHYYLRHDALLLYGDAVAHINIARRVFDSRTPGLLQLGTVWLPLPHLLMIPFLISNWAWRTGIGGSIPSMFAYVFGVVGIFRLVRGGLNFHSQAEAEARIAAWMAAGIFAANPNLIYLQSTAMTEPLYLAFFIWAVVHFCEYVQELDRRNEGWHGSSLTKCWLCLAGACLTRYDGWFLAAAMCAALLLVIFTAQSGDRQLGREFRKFVMLVAIVPVLWLAYNAIVYRNPLEFANGPYSARAIEQKTAAPGSPGHPGSHDLTTAGSYFLKSAESNLGEGNWQRLWVAMLLVGILLSLVSDRRLWPLLLLGVPLPFYMLSVAYGGVPIFLPVWWPFSLYNARYGLQLLPAFAVFIALAAYFGMSFARTRAVKTVVVALVMLFIVGCYASVWLAQPVCFREAWINSRPRMPLEAQLAAKLNALPPNSTFLMYLGDHVGALQRAGIPLRRVINEGNHRTWKQPVDTEGLWERALVNPEQFVDYVVAVDGDAVATAVHKDQLSGVVEVIVPNQPRATIYQTHPASPVIRPVT